MKISIIVPVYNEEKTLASVIQAIKTAKTQPGITKEIIIVNDGSTDRSREILDGFLNDPEISIVHQENKGKTSALKTGIDRSTGDLILIQDADLEYSPGHYTELLQPILDKNCDVVFGSRFLGKINDMKLINRLANVFSNITFNILHGTHITDINTGFKVIPGHIMKDITITSSGFTFETEITSKITNRGYKISEVPISYQARPRHEGKKINWGSALEMFSGIFKYLNKK